MKHHPSAAVIFLSAALVVLSGWNYQDVKPVAQLTKVVGVVEVRSSSTAAWHLVSVNSRIMSDSELRTKAQSFVLVTFSDNSKALVREKSIIKILGNTVFAISQGNVGFDLKDSAEFEIDSPYAFAILHNAMGLVTYDSKTRVAVYTVSKGTAEITCKQKDGKLTVTAGHSATIDSSGCRVN